MTMLSPIAPSTVHVEAIRHARAMIITLELEVSTHPTDGSPLNKRQQRDVDSLKDWRRRLTTITTDAGRGNMSDALITDAAARNSHRADAELAALGGQAPEHSVTPRAIRYSSISVYEYRRKVLHRSE